MLRKLYGDMTRNAFAYRMLIPYVVFLALLVLYPIIANFVISLQADGLA